MGFSQRPRNRAQKKKLSRHQLRKLGWPHCYLFFCRKYFVQPEEQHGFRETSIYSHLSKTKHVTSLTKQLQVCISIWVIRLDFSDLPSLPFPSLPRSHAVADHEFAFVEGPRKGSGDNSDNSQDALFEQDFFALFCKGWIWLVVKFQICKWYPVARRGHKKKRGTQMACMITRSTVGNNHADLSYHARCFDRFHCKTIDPCDVCISFFGNGHARLDAVDTFFSQNDGIKCCIMLYLWIFVELPVLQVWTRLLLKPVLHQILQPLWYI